MPTRYSSVSAKGQVTIPIEARKALGLEPGDRVAFTIENGDIRLKAARHTLMESYQAIPALNPPPLGDPIEIAREEHLQHVVREGL